MKTAVIIVNYHNQPLTIHFVKNELGKVSEKLCVIIVNNDATSHSDGELVTALDAELVKEGTFRTSASSVYVISSPENLGFAQANNLAVDFIHNYLKTDYLLFTNNDIVIQDPDIIQQLIQKLDADYRIGMIGPQIVGIDGEKQSPFPYQLFWDRYVRMYLYTPFMTKEKKVERFELNYQENAREGFHYRIMGSFFLMRLADYLAIGGMDPGTFLYAEEMILSERLKQINKGVYYYPQAIVQHIHGATTKKSMTHRTICLEKMKSECYYYHQYMHVPELELFIGCRLYKCIQSLKYLVKR